MKRVKYILNKIYTLYIPAMTWPIWLISYIGPDKNSDAFPTKKSYVRLLFSY